MADTTLLFFLGLALMVALQIVARHYQAPQNWVLPAGTELTVALLAAALIVLAAVIAYPTLFQFSKYGWLLLRSVALGCWIAFLAGCAAGFVVAAAVNAINAVSTWGAWSESRTNIIILSAGPGLTILILYMLSMPGVMQKLGLTGIKAGDFEITLSPSQIANIPTDVPAFTPAQASLGKLADKYTPWFQNIWPMFQNLKDHPSEADFIDLAYFQRQALYVKYEPKEFSPREQVKHPKVPLTEDQARQDLPSGVAQAIWYQEQFLRSLRPVIGCGGFYHRYFPDAPTIRPLISPLLETLLRVEIEVEETAAKGLSAIANPQVNQDLVTLQRQATALLIHFHDEIPPSLQIDNSDEEKKDLPSWSDCEPKNSKKLTSWLNFASDKRPTLTPPQQLQIDRSLFDIGLTVEPPYLAIVIANMYGALGEKEAGLSVLNSWIKWYQGLKHDEPDSTRWIYDEAVWQYGLVQEADETLPTTTSERKYLQRMQVIFETDWRIDLGSSGYKCEDTQTKTDLEVQEQSDVKADPEKKFASGIETRLVLLYSNLLQRLLYATLQTLPTLDHDYLTPEHEDWARQLISSAQRCFLDEKPRWQDYRQALDGLVGGVTLARWAEDGPRSGLVHPSTVPDVQKDAVKALVDALPKIRENERDDGKMDGLRSMPTEWESYRRIVNQTVLDLQAKLTK